MFNESIKSISFVGSSPIIFLLAALVIVFMLIRRDWLNAGFILFSLASGLYSAFIKSIFKLSRPSGYVYEGFIPWEQILKSEVYSFPSTHVVMYTAFFGYLIYLSYILKGVNKLIKKTFRIYSAIMIAFVGVSRILLGAHYLRDVLAGYIFGFVYLGLLIAGERFLAQKLSNKPPKHKKP